SSNEILIQNFAFSPSTLTIKVGDSVTWKNQDSASHTIVSDSGSEISSSSLSNGGIYTHTFSIAGTYNYHCSIHPSMKGKVVVQ
ncbi:MAG: plastocyanin/azurin family copper-binding protein, partial [Ferruginibacter sp.]